LEAIFSAKDAENMTTYYHQRPEWPKYTWDFKTLADQLATVRHRQGRLIGRMEGLGFALRNEAMLQTLTQDVLKSSEIEGEILNADQVRSSIARRLGMDIGALTPADRNVEGVVEMTLDATQNYDKPLTPGRLFGWHASLFPTGYSGIHKITIGAWRTDQSGPVQVVSGQIGKERVHYQAPAAPRLAQEMKTFLEWYNADGEIDPVLKSGLAHLWFVTIHPFDDGNGRIARAIADMSLARSEKSSQRFYSMSAQIRKERNAYYNILESTQKQDTGDVTPWLQWFLACLDRAFEGAETTLTTVLKKAKFWETHPAAEFNERQRDMLDRLFERFYGALNTSKWAKIEKCSADTALRDITDLVERGVLKKDPGGGRSTTYSLVQE
jgi:Fic family protein